jgi:hypothetical protein
MASGLRPPTKLVASGRVTLAANTSTTVAALVAASYNANGDSHFEIPSVPDWTTVMQIQTEGDTDDVRMIVGGTIAATANSQRTGSGEVLTDIHSSVISGARLFCTAGASFTIVLAGY